MVEEQKENEKIKQFHNRSRSKLKYEINVSRPAAKDATRSMVVTERKSVDTDMMTPHDISIANVRLAPRVAHHRRKMVKVISD